jgi:hypothetical protein
MILRGNMAKKYKNKKKKSGANHLKRSRAIDIDQKTLKDIILSSKVDDQYDRIYKILDVEDVEDENNAAVNYENLGKYLAYLKKRLNFLSLLLALKIWDVSDGKNFTIGGQEVKRNMRNLRRNTLHSGMNMNS